jgi:hypothetical protein
MTPAWARRQEELLSDCVVSPDVFKHMVDRLGEFVVPYQHALETEAGKRNVHGHLDAELLATSQRDYGVELWGPRARMSAGKPMWRAASTSVSL